MIVKLAIKTGHLPSQWAEQDPIDVMTAVSILEEIDRDEAARMRERSK